MKALVVSLLVLSGCATFTHRNMNIYDRQKPIIVAYEARVIIENITEGFGFKYNKVAAMETKAKALIDYVISKLGHEDLFNGYDLVFMSNWVSQSISDNERAIGDGITYLSKKVIYLMVRDCFADSSILHEMSHVIRADAKGDGDQGHRDRALWNSVSIMSKQMVQDLCPADYVRHDTPPTLIN